MFTKTCDEYVPDFSDGLQTVDFLDSLTLLAALLLAGGLFSSELESL